MHEADLLQSWPGDWKTGRYTWPPSFIISGPLEFYYSPIILDNQVVEPKGRICESWSEAYYWVKERYEILEVLHGAEKYGRWAFRCRI